MSGYKGRIRLKTIDAFKRMRVGRYYSFYLESMTWDREKIKKYQHNKLNELLNSAYRGCPYYHDIFKSTGLGPGIKVSLSEFSNIPYLEREVIADSGEALYNSEYYSSGKKFKSSSSGTTGLPIRYVHDVNAESAGIAAGYALMNMAGWHPGSRQVHIWGNRLSIEKWKSVGSRFKRIIMNQMYYPAYGLNMESDYEDLYTRIIKYRPEYIDGYSGVISGFAFWLADNKKRINDVKGVYTTAENLADYQKDAIEMTIGPVCDLYGSGEINGIALRASNTDRYFILDTHVIVETERVNGRNEILVTDLDNITMPLIRYKIGDTIDELTGPDNESEMALSSFKSIDGRSNDIIELGENKVLYPVTLFGGTFLRKLNGIRRHKVEWDGRRLKFIFEADGEFNKDIVLDRIRRELEEYNVNFEVSVTKSILPGPNGKYRFFENVTGQTR